MVCLRVVLPASGPSTSSPKIAIMINKSDESNLIGDTSYLFCNCMWILILRLPLLLTRLQNFINLFVEVSCKIIWLMGISLLYWSNKDHFTLRNNYAVKMESFRQKKTEKNLARDLWRIILTATPTVTFLKLFLWKFVSFLDIYVHWHISQLMLADAMEYTWCNQFWCVCVCVWCNDVWITTEKYAWGVWVCSNISLLFSEQLGISYW